MFAGGVVTGIRSGCTALSRGNKDGENLVEFRLNGKWYFGSCDMRRLWADYDIGFLVSGKTLNQRQITMLY